MLAWFKTCHFQVTPSGIPSFWSSNGAEHLGEDGLLLQQGEEARHERQEPVLPGPSGSLCETIFGD